MLQRAEVSLSRPAKTTNAASASSEPVAQISKPRQRADRHRHHDPEQGQLGETADDVPRVELVGDVGGRIRARLILLAV